jgi:hypothetical protein
MPDPPQFVNYSSAEGVPLTSSASKVTSRPAQFARSTQRTTDSPLHLLSPKTSSLWSIRQASALVTVLLVLPTPGLFMPPASQGQAHAAMPHKQMATAMQMALTAFLPALPRRPPHPAIPVISLLRQPQHSRRSTRPSMNSLLAIIPTGSIFLRTSRVITITPVPVPQLQRLATRQTLWCKQWPICVPLVLGAV